MNKSDLEVLPEILFNFENVKKICYIWSIFDDVAFSNDYEIIIIHYNNQQFIIKNWNNFFNISKKYFF